MEQQEETIEVGGGMRGEVKQFCYLEEILDSEGGMERAVRGKLAASWSKW